GITGKAKLLTQIIFSIFRKESITEEEMEKMKSQDMLHSMLADLTEYIPRLKKQLIDVRDQYLAEMIRTAQGDRVVAVLGAAHVPGINNEIHTDHDLDRLNERPAKSKIPKMVAWAIPIFIIAVIAYTFYTNPSAGIAQTISWVLWNGSFSALVALI